jgi:hypothetical protein
MYILNNFPKTPQPAQLVLTWPTRLDVDVPITPFLIRFHIFQLANKPKIILVLNVKFNNPQYQY